MLPPRKVQEFYMRSETVTKDRAKHINWDTAVFMALFHLGAVAALFMSS